MHRLGPGIEIPFWLDVSKREKCGKEDHGSNAMKVHPW